MCEECKVHPCSPRCPDAETPAEEVFDKCAICKGAIMVGEEYFSPWEEVYHADCIYTVPVKDVLAWLGFFPLIAD